MSEQEIIAWVDHSWKLAVRKGWAWDGYYFYLVKAGLNLLCGKPDYWR